MTTVKIDGQARQRVIQARTALVLDHPFFGALALKLRLVEDPTCPTAWTDGKSLGYNPEFVTGLTSAQLNGLVCHEVLHCANGHPWRRGGREPKAWNVAADMAINPIVRDAGHKLPDGGLFPNLLDMEEGKSSEWYYARLPKQGGGKGKGQEGAPGSGDGQGKGDPGEDGARGSGGQQDLPEPAAGEVRDAPADAAEQGCGEEDWRAATQQAANAARARGDLPGALERFADERAEPLVDWRSVLRRFIQQVSRADYTWTRPSRRFLYRNMYLPGLHSERMGTIVIAVDTSGSIDNATLSQFAAEMNAIVEDAKPERVEVIYCDARVQHRDTFEEGEPVRLNPKGGGGTRFEPVFQAVEEDGEDPAALVYLTDLMGSFPSEEPPYPVLWASISPGEAPFGETVHVWT